VCDPVDRCIAAAGRDAGMGLKHFGQRKRPGSIRIPGLCVQSLEGVRLCASLSRMHLIVVLEVPLGALQGCGKVQGVRTRIRTAADDSDQGHRDATHERTLTRDGSNA